MLLHGWEGSARSNYVLNTGARLLREGFDVFRLNFRDHGETHHLNREIFHSCRIDEVVNAVREVAQRFRPRAFAIAGFSLGGNFALRVALRAPAARIPLDYALAVCPVVNPSSVLFGLERGPLFYERYFLHRWTRSLRTKQALFPDAELFSSDELKSSLRDLTRSLVLRHTEFGSLENYLKGYSIAGDALASLRVPATILTSADDPVIPIARFPIAEVAAAGRARHRAARRALRLHHGFLAAQFHRGLHRRKDAGSDRRRHRAWRGRLAAGGVCVATVSRRVAATTRVEPSSRRFGCIGAHRA